jgi:hypothetical protein
MKRKKPPTPAPNGGSPEDQIAKEVERYSAKIAELFALLRDLPSPSPEAPGAPLSKAQARAAEISADIRRLTRAMNELRERTGGWYRKEGSQPDSDAARLRREIEDEKVRLQQRLGRVADAQVALVAEWNADPVETRREAFEREYRRLAQEYSDVLAEVRRVRKRLTEL